VFVPVALADRGAALRARGFATVAALGPVEDAAAEARRLACTHLAADDGEASPLEGPLEGQ
jgi:ATP phosphoribosyltransferase regulatory subunit